MSKSTPTKRPIHHKKQKGLRTEKVWEQSKEHHITNNELHGKARQPKHFPTRRWHIQLENHKGPKF